MKRSRGGERCDLEEKTRLAGRRWLRGERERGEEEEGRTVRLKGKDQAGRRW